MKFAVGLAVCASPVAIAMSAGCGSISYFIHSVPTAQAQYRAYGDSITNGTFLPDPETQAYPALVALDEGVSFANNAVSGDQACDLATDQIFPNRDSPTLADHPTYTILIGSNDLSELNPYAYESVFLECHQAAVAWLALPAEYKSLAGGMDMHATGPGMLDTSNSWNAWTTQAEGATVSFSIVTSKTGPIYAWPRIDDNSPATYTYSLDAVTIGSARAQTLPRIHTRNNGDNSITLIRIENVPAGRHTVTFTQTNAGAEGVSVLGIGTPEGTASGKLPIVLAGTIPFQEKGGRCSTTDKLCLTYIQGIEDDVTLFAADGLNVRLFDDRKYMFGNANEMSDVSHPNVLGHIEISHSVEAVW